jgi:hypothetical protein
MPYRNSLGRVVVRFCLLSSGFCVLPLLSACNILGAVAYKTLGPNEVAPEYKPPQEPMLVLAESYGKTADLQPAADELAALLGEELKAHKVAPLVAQAKLMELRNGHGKEFDKMKIPEVGRAVGAKQVLYVDLQACEVDGMPGSDMIQGKIAAKVRVVDVETGKTRWPDVGDGYEFKQPSDYVRKEQRDTPLAVRNQMLEDLASAIARLFYGYRPDYDTGRGVPAD